MAPEVLQSYLLPPVLNSFYFLPHSLHPALLSTIVYAKLFHTPGTLHMLASPSGMFFPPIWALSPGNPFAVHVTSSEEDLPVPHQFLLY